MGEKYYDNALYSELQVCLNQIKTEIDRADAYFYSKKDFNGVYLMHNEMFYIFWLNENLRRIDAERLGMIWVPNAYDDWTMLHAAEYVNPITKQVGEQRRNSINCKNPLLLPFGEFYGYTIYNILYKNYDWIKYAFQKYNADLYGHKEYQTAVKGYFEKAFAFYMRFENVKA